jgi:hypothetical protein
MIKSLSLVTGCLLLVVSASVGASAQQLSGPAPAACSASAPPEWTQGDLFAPKPKPMTCGVQCYANEGGTTSTQTSLGGPGSCSLLTSDLTTRLTAEANAACKNLTGLNACNIVMHFTGCVADGSSGFFIQYGYATYGCKDTNC